MTDLPPMVPSAIERIVKMHGVIEAGTRVVDNVRFELNHAYRDGQQSRQPEIDALNSDLDRAWHEQAAEALKVHALRAALAEAERALIAIRDDEDRQQSILDVRHEIARALARIREVKRDG